MHHIKGKNMFVFIDSEKSVGKIHQPFRINRQANKQKDSDSLHFTGSMQDSFIKVTFDLFPYLIKST